MDARELILTELRDLCRYESYQDERDGFTWDDYCFLRTAVIRIQQGDTTAWHEVLNRLSSCPNNAETFRFRLKRKGYLYVDNEIDFSDEYPIDYIYDNLRIGSLPLGTTDFVEEDAEALLFCLRDSNDMPDVPDVPDEPPQRERYGRSQVMYIEYKGGKLAGPGRIGRVTFSQSRKTIYYKDCKLQSLKGHGYKANFYDAANGGWYWVSNCRRDGQDTLYPGIVEIDDDVRKEYWTSVRERSDLIQLTSFRSEGKYSKRRPQPEKPNHHASGPRL